MGRCCPGRTTWAGKPGSSGRWPHGRPGGEILFDDAGELIGVPFYVMEKVDGYVIRGDLPAAGRNRPRPVRRR